jgi:hypothetical protein
MQHLTPADAPHTAVGAPKSRSWASLVIVTATAAAAGNAAQCLVNLVERHYQEQAAAGHRPPADTIRDALDALHVLGTLTLVATLVFFVAACVWSSKRRQRGAVRLRNVCPPVYWLFWGAALSSLVASTVGKSLVHSGMTATDFVHYRTYLAASNAARCVMWLSWVPLVMRASKLDGAAPQMVGQGYE